MKKPEDQFDLLFGETPEAARHREASAFDKASQGRCRIVIFGAGRLGRKILAVIKNSDLDPVAFADNNFLLWGQTVDGLPVLSPKDAAARYSCNSTFVVAIWHPDRSPLISKILAQLRGIGCRAIGFPTLFWRHPQAFLPYFFWDLPSKLLQSRAGIEAAFKLLDDDASRQAFVWHLQLRSDAAFESAGNPASEEQYFPGLFSLSPDECFVDCGAFTGDSIVSFLAQTGDAFRKIIAFEADSAVLPALEEFMHRFRDRGVLHKSVVGSRPGTSRFAGDGVGGGRVNDAVGIDVPCVCLDDALQSERVSFIKMDIEGAELQALEGARRIIERDRPVLAVCGYHDPDHLWRVPTTLKELAPDSALFLRTHCADGLDAVYYAVPPERRAHIGDKMARPLSETSNAQARGSFS